MRVVVPNEVRWFLTVAPCDDAVGDENRKVAVKVSHIMSSGRILTRPESTGVRYQNITDKVSFVSVLGLNLGHRENECVSLHKTGVKKNSPSFS